jgi:hypothetical protein
MRRTEREALDVLRRAEASGFSGAFSGRHMRRALMVRLRARGFVRPLRMAVCDGDGFALDPERWREGWCLTADGKRALLAGGASVSGEEKR